MTVPTLTPRALREQRAFRALMEGMARPGTIHQVTPHEFGDGYAPSVALLEALLDHEVTFAAAPGSAGFEETVLRLTGSSVADLEVADYVIATGDGVLPALARAKPGELEHPDRNATVVMQVAAVGNEGQGSALTVAGPGIETTETVWIDGVSAEQIAAIEERNAEVPLGIDVVVVGPDGRLVCLTRYVRIIKKEGAQWDTPQSAAG